MGCEESQPSPPTCLSQGILGCERAVIPQIKCVSQPPVGVPQGILSQGDIVPRAADWLELVQEAGQTVAGKTAARLGILGPRGWCHHWGLATAIMEPAVSVIQNPHYRAKCTAPEFFPEYQALPLLDTASLRTLWLLSPSSLGTGTGVPVLATGIAPKAW